MSALLTLTACALASWLLRIAFITVLPADRLPAAVRRALRNAGPAVLAAMIVTSLLDADSAAGLVPSPRHLALFAAALVAWRWRNLAAAIGTAIAVMLLVEGSS